MRRIIKGWARYGWQVGVAMAVAVGAPQVALAERPLKQLPADVLYLSLAGVALPKAMAEVTKKNGLLAGASWGVIKGSSDVLGRVVSLMDEAPHEGESTSGDKDRSLAWLNLREKDLRSTRHDPALLRYTF